MLAAQVVGRRALRYTPAGLPALDITLKHESTVEQEGGTRRVAVEIEALAIGTTLTLPLDALAIGSSGMFAGFLSARRNGRGVLFHLTSFDSLPDAG